VAGRVTLLLELKSHFDGNPRLVERTAEVLKGYAGPVAVMSFDPDLIEAARHTAPTFTTRDRGRADLFSSRMEQAARAHENKIWRGCSTPPALVRNSLLTPS
jgi:glycerophosphoryl diester phosphodiesterase